MPPSGSLPIEVKVFSRILFIRSIDDTAETFECRFSLHLTWTDMYYKLPSTADGKYCQSADLVRTGSTDAGVLLSSHHSAVVCTCIGGLRERDHALLQLSKDRAEGGEHSALTLAQITILRETP